MGWSCSAAAAKTLETWTEFCFRHHGSQNTWKIPSGERFFFEVSHTEHEDGAITGQIFRLDSVGAIRTSTFRIEGDGRVSRAPEILRRATALASIPVLE